MYWKCRVYINLVLHFHRAFLGTVARVWNKGIKFCKELISCILNVLLSVSNVLTGQKVDSDLFLSWFCVVERSRLVFMSSYGKALVPQRQIHRTEFSITQLLSKHYSKPECVKLPF